MVSPGKMNLNNWFIPNPFIYSAVSSNWPYIDYPKFRKAIAFCKNTDQIMVLNGTLSLFDSEQKCKQRSAQLCTFILFQRTSNNHLRYSINDRTSVISRRSCGEEH